MDELIDEIYTILKDDSSEELTKDIQTMKTQLIILKQTIENEVVLAKKNNQVKTLFKAYQIIMKFRELFTGEVINYRIYYATSTKETSFKNNVSVYDLSEKELAKLLIQQGTSLRLIDNFTEALDNQNQYHNAQREEIFVRHWQNISNGLTTSLKTGTNKQTGKSYQYRAYRVHKFIFDLYSKINPGLINSKQPNSYQIFNRGHIYEAFEATADDLYGNISAFDFTKETTVVQLAWFEHKYFGKYLALDSVKGFKGGDVGLNQIKARKAQLIEASTLVNYLKIIISLLDLAVNYNFTSFKTKIKTEFLDQVHKDINENIDTIIDNSLNKLLSLKSK